MSLRTRQGLGVLASLMMVVAACGSGTTSTTAPPAATSAPPAATSAPPAATSAPPAATSAPPAETSAPPAETSAPPAETSAPPAETSAPPAETSAPPTPGGVVDPYTALFGSTYAPEAGTPGGVLVYGEWQPVSQLNPYFSSAFATVEAVQPAWRGLLNISGDGKWIPDLAPEIPTPKNGGVKLNEPEGGFTVTAQIKPNLKWSDGTPLTLNDFKATYDWALENLVQATGCGGCGAFAPLIDSSKDATGANLYVKSIEVAADGLSMTVVWNKNYAGWIGWLSSTILPPKVTKDTPIADSAKSMPVSADILNVPASGPFKISAASSDEIDYVRNDMWVGGFGTLTQPHPAYLDELKFKFFGTKDGMITAFLNGEIDLALDMTQADFPAIQGVSPDIGYAELVPAWQYEHFDMNTTRPGLDDVKVRTAIAQAIDKKAITDVLFPGATSTPACSPAPPGTWWRIETECPAFDPAAAAAALDAAGWPVSEETGLRTKGEDVLRFKACTTSGNPTRLTELQQLVGFMGAVGIPVDIETADATSVVFAGWADLEPQPGEQPKSCSIYRGTFDIADYAYVLGGDVYSNYFYSYHSSQWPDKGNHSGSNVTRFSDPVMDAALETLGIAVDPAEQFAAASDVQKAFSAGTPEIPIYYRNETTGVGVRMGNWPTYNPSSAGPSWNVEDWYVKGGG